MGHQYSTNKLFIVGNNSKGYLGIGNCDEVKELKEWDNNMEIDCLYIGYGFTIFKNNENEYFGCGRNKQGQCAIGKFCDNIRELTMIKYFTNHNIKIKNIFLNVMNWSLFWMNKNGEIYTNGRNDRKQLGLKDNKNRNIPEIVMDLKHIIDIKGNEYCCIAIDKYGNVFGSGESKWYGVKDKNIDRNGKWNKIKSLNNIKIIKIDCGKTHALYLTSNGIVYSGGYDSGNYGVLGNGE
eukprot:268502_1